MGYTIKQKIDICLKAESDPGMTQADLAIWAQLQYGGSKPPSQTTISRILSSKNDLIASKETDFQLVRRRKQLNPLLRKILSEWITQACWEHIPITTPIIQLTANAIWNRLPNSEKDGNGIFNHKWCNYFIKKLNINLAGNLEDIQNNPSNYKLNKVWKLDEKLELKSYLKELIERENYRPCDIFTIDEFKLFYSLPLDQIFDVSSIDKGLKQSSFSTENSLTIMLGCNLDGLEKLTPLIVGKYDRFDVSQSSENNLKHLASTSVSTETLMNKITRAYQLSYKSNTNKWITSSMFQNYLLTLEHKLSNLSPKRKLLIILDDSSSHRIINLKFKNIRLCYLKNNNDHRNPYNSVYSGSKFDYLPMSFGIIEEFKILYRLQQYLEMINLQRINVRQTNGDGPFPLSKSNSINFKDFKSMMDGTSNTTVLAESDYHIPLIKVIEWIKRSWDSISPEKIFSSWRRTHLINLRDHWPTSSPAIKSAAQQSILPLIARINNYNPSKSHQKLEEVMKYLSVVIPWEIDDLLGLVNERGKITLSYGSIEEIIGSCLLESHSLGDIDNPFSDNTNNINNNTGMVTNSGLNSDSNWYDITNSNLSTNNPLASPSLSGSSSSSNSPQQPLELDNDLAMGLLNEKKQPQNPQQLEGNQPTNLEFYSDLNDTSVLNLATMNIDLLLSAAGTNIGRPSLVATNSYRSVTRQQLMSAPDQFSLDTSIPLNDASPLLGVDDSSPQQPLPPSQGLMSNDAVLKSQTNDFFSRKRHLEDISSVNNKKRIEMSPKVSRQNLNLSQVSPPLLNDSLPSTTTSSPQFIPAPPKTVFSGISYRSKSSSSLYTKNNSQSPAATNKADDNEMMILMRKLLSNVNSPNTTVKLSHSTINELKLNLLALQNRQANKERFPN